MFNEVSCVIPGASNHSQIENNIFASEHEDLNKEQLEKVKFIYESYIKNDVHHLW